MATRPRPPFPEDTLGLNRRVIYMKQDSLMNDSSSSKGRGAHPVLLTIIGAAVGAVVTVGAGYLVNLWTSRPPQIRSMAVDWVGRDGEYNIEGVVDNLEAGQLVWSYNQPLDASQPGSLYPQPGPCPVDASGRFSCDMGWAGEAGEEGATFRVWVAIVTDEDAAATEAVRNMLDNDENYFPNIRSIPRLSGDGATMSMDSSRPQ
jgi:hypothetical protein